MDQHQFFRGNPVSLCKRKLISKHHLHELSYLSQKDKNYSSSGWSCDICKIGYNKDIKSMHCQRCGWDLCDTCLSKEFQFAE